MLPLQPLKLASLLGLARTPTMVGQEGILTKVHRSQSTLTAWQSSPHHSHRIASLLHNAQICQFLAAVDETQQAL